MKDINETPIGSHGKYLVKKLFTLLDLCVSSLRRGHANLLCIVPILIYVMPEQSQLYHVSLPKVSQLHELARTLVVCNKMS